jgi:hypothetical protein
VAGHGWSRGSYALAGWRRHPENPYVLDWN